MGLSSTVAGVLFLGFVGLTLAAALCQRKRCPWHGTITNLLILYTIGATLLAVVSRRDLWPFSSWALMVGAAPVEIGEDPQGLRLLAVDESGGEHFVDYRSWQPISIEELGAWLRLEFPKLSPPEQDRVSAFLLEKANAGRASALAGDSPGYFDRYLGVLTAPHHLLHPAIWSDPENVPRQPFVGIRMYREYWNVEERRHDPSAMRLVLVYQSPVRP